MIYDELEFDKNKQKPRYARHRYTLYVYTRMHVKLRGPFYTLSAYMSELAQETMLDNTKSDE